MRLEIDIPEHQYNNIMSIDSISLGRAPYKGIIMYAINAIKHGRVLKQEPTTKNDLGVDCIDRKKLIDWINIWDITPIIKNPLIRHIQGMSSATPQEPTKNDLAVDCVARQDVERYIEGFINEYTPKEELEFINLELDGLKHIPTVTPQEPRWISVSEGLPEEGQWVMVTFDGKIAVCIAHDNDGTLREATSLVLKNATEIWLYPESEWGDGYAAWMPLPKPYEPMESEG